MIKRTLGLFLKYISIKWKYRGRVSFNGFAVVYAFPDSKIHFKGEGITINSHPFSNLVGLYQRSVLVARYGGTIEIGANTGISGSTIYAMDSIAIGERVNIGGNCKIIDNDFHPLHFSQRHPQKPENIKKRPIIIGDDCFIGMNTIILKGTVLGKNCVVGAGSVVHGIWPDNSIIAGNPAKRIGENKLSDEE